LRSAFSSLPRCLNWDRKAQIKQLYQDIPRGRSAGIKHLCISFP
jgi:hypothetical protein